MAKAKKVYWDSGLFISYLSDTHPNEKARADIVVDLLNHAREGKIEIWTSVWTMMEVIRPKSPVPDVFPLPEWAELLNSKDAKGNVRFPKASAHLTQIWEHYKRNTLDSRTISDEDAGKIRAMFDWPWINKIDVVPSIAQHACDLMRAHNIKAGDSIHVASALYRKCEVLHTWDKDFSKIAHLIQPESPMSMSQVVQTGNLFSIGQWKLTPSEPDRLG